MDLFNDPANEQFDPENRHIVLRKVVFQLGRCTRGWIKRSESAAQQHGMGPECHLPHDVLPQKKAPVDTPNCQSLLNYLNATANRPSKNRQII